MAKYTGKIYTNTFNILPNRLPYFEERMKFVKKAADSKVPKIPFDYVVKPGISVPLATYLIPMAQSNRLPDSRQNSKGDWVRDVNPVEITHGELASEDFERIGYIKFKDLTGIKAGGGKAFLPYVVPKDGTWTQADFDQRVIDILPQLESLAANFNDKTDLNCHHCQPSAKGDKKSRDIVQIIRAKKDCQRTGGIQSNTFPMDIKEGQILQIGSGCFKKYTGINIKALSALYEMDRTPSIQTSGSPQGRTGYGYSEMGVWDFAERMVRYYGQREKEWLTMKNKSLWELDDPKQIYDKGTLAPLIDGRSNYKGGCFVEGAGTRLLQGRMFNMETDPNKSARWYLQPWTGTGSVKQMQEDWANSINNARVYVSVPVVNELTGETILDPATGDVLMKDEALPDPAYIDQMIHARKRKGNYLGKGWRTAVVPVFAPATDKKYVQKTLNRMMEWIENLKPSGKHGALQLRIKGIVEMNYVGTQTKNDMIELWRMFMYADFPRRQQMDKRQQTRQFQKIGSDTLSVSYPDSKWYSFDKDDESYIVDYISPLYTGSVNRYSSYYGNRGDISKAFSYKYHTVFLTPAEWQAFPAWMVAKKKKEDSDLKERDAQHKYNSAVSLIYREQRREYPYPMQRKIPYDAPVDDFLNLMGWDAINDPARFNHATSLFQIINGEVKVALLTNNQFDAVMTKFRPQIQGHTPSTPSAPVFTQPVPTQAATPTSKMPRITLKEAKIKRDSARSTSSFQGTVGNLIPLVEGWIVFKSGWEGGLKPTKHDNTWGTKGKLLGLMDAQGNYYVIPHPTAATSQPRLGNYYNLFNVEVIGHDTYKGLLQTFITDPVDWIDLDFVDATN